MVINRKLPGDVRDSFPLTYDNQFVPRASRVIFVLAAGMIFDRIL